MANEGKLAKQILGESRPARSLGTAEQSITAHPMFQDALETLALQKKLDPAKYNELLNRQADEIAKNIRRPLPGGNKGTSYPVGPETPWVYYTGPNGKLEKITRARAEAGELPQGAQVHNLSRDDVIRELGGLREVPTAPKPSAAPTADADRAVQEALDVTRQRRLAEEARTASPEEGIYAAATDTRAAEAARQAAAAPQATPSATPAGTYTPTPGYGAASGPWGTAATRSPMPGLLNDQAYAAWLKDVNRRARDLTQAGAATGAGALYYLGLPKDSAPSAGEMPEGNFSPRRDQPAPYTERPNYSPVTDSAKDVLRQRLTTTPVDPSYAPDFDSFQNFAKSIVAQRPTDPAEFARLDFMHPVGAGRGYMTEEPGARAAANAAIAAAAEKRAAQRQNISNAQATGNAASSGSGFSLGNLLGKVYDPNYQKDMSSKQLFEAAQRDSDNPAAFFRASNRWKEENPNYSPTDSGMKRGGTAKAAAPHKDAALHKALDIIHSMLSRR